MTWVAVGPSSNRVQGDRTLRPFLLGELSQRDQLVELAPPRAPRPASPARDSKVKPLRRFQG